MLSRLYKKHSIALLVLVALSFPILRIQAKSLKSNNDIETWLPQGSEVRATYEAFKQKFGIEETILIGIERHAATDELTESLCRRLDRLPGVRGCWSLNRLQAMMGDFGVSEEESRARLQGLMVSKNGDLSGVIVSLSNTGSRDRGGTVRDIRRELDYCQLTGNDICLTGAPVIVSELDRLGGREENEKFFIVTLIICLGLLYYWINDWKLSLLVLGLTVYAIDLTQTLFLAMGGQMNFILGALPVMVMVFTLEASIHVIHYYKASAGSADPLAETLRLCWKPCLISMTTTGIGLFSVSVTDIVPVTQFGYASALGAVVAVFCGLCITPAFLAVLPQSEAQEVAQGNIAFARLGNWLLGHSKPLTVCTISLAGVAFVGLFWLQSRINPMDFLPKDAKAVTDLLRIENELTNVNSIEAVVDFTNSDLPFVERLKKVRHIEETIRQHPAVRQTMSAASFFPSELPENPLALMKLLQRAESRSGDSEFIVKDQQLWRISARIARPNGIPLSRIHYELEVLTAGSPVTITGIAPLLEQAQREIFDGFWKSFVAAIAVIGLVMAIALRSLRIAVLAMIPNVVPLGIVFGILGWVGFPVDIGMMMTGSIALGISIDGTFHFLVRYLEQMEAGKTTQYAVRVALLTTGGPIFESIVVSSIGMLALTLSSFSPTARFGMLMATLLMATLAGDLLLLPALLTLKSSPKKTGTGVPKPNLVERAHAAHLSSNLATDRVA